MGTDSHHKHRSFDLSDNIVARLRAREESAYDELIDKCFARLVRFSYHIVGSFDTAEDVVQDVIIRIVNMGGEFDPKSGLQEYLLTAVRNRSLTVIRDSSRHEKLNQTISEPFQAAISTDSAAMFQDIERYMSSLTERQRSAMWLRFYEQRSIPEVAAILGISPDSAKELIQRAVQSLRTKFSKE